MAVRAEAVRVASWRVEQIADGGRRMDDDTAALPDRARREASLSVMHDRFDGVGTRFRDVYGLRLPRHMAVFAAFFDSLGKEGRDLADDVLGLRPDGITSYFDADGLALTGRDGLDERLESRFRCDPPEFVTIMSGDSDGLHFGLWYDDPAEPPSFVVHNYARDSAETWTGGRRSGLGEILRQIDKRDEDASLDPEMDDPAAQRRRDALRQLVEEFGDADRQACAVDGPSRWADVHRPPILGALCPALPADAGDPRGGYERSNERYQAYRAGAPEVRDWIAQAERELAVGAPAYALVLGQELHWMDAAAFRADSLRLLTGAYRALGRDALAGIAAVHHAHRGLRSVGVLTRASTPLA
ncbi:ADP-ribosylation family protein [Catellatospora sichuanensis]|uniref:ADP-ribosylation family protein n=1 Tax=Catellatospora sichuanensis TaxID=1969805 RepID=UPI0016424360|nr:ADP-ribosylation family protein [Catellatospora sichuanensis]